MRYLMRFEATIDAGGKVDRSGGAGAAIGSILGLLKPEAVYVSVFKREITMVANSDDPKMLGEAAHVVQLVAGTNIDVTPVITGDEAMAILPETIAKAVKTVTSLGF